MTFMSDQTDADFPAISLIDWKPTSTSEYSPMYSQEQFNFVLNEVIVPILFGIITFVGVIGNCLVIYVILSKDRMRTVTNLLLLNLAAADLIFVLVIPSVTAYQFATFRWPFGNAACKLMHYIVNVTAYITVYTLVLVTIVRYMTIVHNATTVALRTRRNVVLLIALIWAVILAVNAPILWSYGVEDRDGTPDCQHRSNEVAQQIFATFFVFGYLLPLAVIGVLSICILHHIAKHRSHVLGTKTRSANKKKRAGMLLVLVVAVFAILWLPIHVHLLIAFFVAVPSGQWYEAVGVLFHCLAYFNSCVNPIIYNHTSKDFRDAFRDAACCGRLPPGGGGGGMGGGGDEGTSAGRRTTTTTQLLPGAGKGAGSEGCRAVAVERIPLCDIRTSQ